MVGFAILLVPHPTQAGFESKDRKQYGNCTVFTGVDLITDKEDYWLLCYGSGESTLAIHFDPDTLLRLTLNTGPQVHIDRTIPVLIRVDKGEVIRRSASWYPYDATIYDDNVLVSGLLQDLAHGQRVYIRVGGQSATIGLPAARQAIADFRQRAGLHAQRSLTIPRQSDF